MGESVFHGAMRRFPSLLAVFLLAAMTAAPASAGEAKKDEKGKGSDGQYVNLSPVALPVIADNRLINFVFVTVRLNLTPSANASAQRDREPYFRDALVRTAYRQPFTVPTNYAQIDVKALKARMMGEAARIAGPGVIASVEIIGEPQPKKLYGLPRPKGAPAPERAPIP